MPWQVPGFRMREDLASGSGRVVLATDESSGQLVVIKYLNLDSSYTSEQLRLAVDDIGGLPDNYFVRIRELVQDSSHNAIVMDPLTGTTMRALIRDGGPFDPESALVVFRDVLTGLAYAHALDIVHGDVSPENVMVTSGGRPVMLNVGAAMWDRREPTLSGGVYLAPERWDGGPPTASADVYAAAVAFVESLVGEPPYWEDSDLELLRSRHASEAIDLSHVPAALHDVVGAGLAKPPDVRLSAASLLDLLETAAIAGYGRDWPDRGRDGVIRRVRSGSPRFGGVPATDAGTTVRDTEDVANDDYYTDAPVTGANPAGNDEPTAESSSADETEPASRDAAAAEVMAAAAEIVAFAQLRDAAEADAILAASVDEDLTEEEESAVAEIERLLFLDEQPLADEPTAASEAIDAAAGDATVESSPIEAASGDRAPADVEPSEAAPADVGPSEAAPAGVESASAAAAEVEPSEAAPAEVDSAAAAPAEVEPAAAPSGPDRVPAQSPPGVEREPVASDPDRTPADAGSDRVPTQAASAESLAAAEVIAAGAAAERAAEHAPVGNAGTAEPVASRSALGSGASARSDGAAGLPSDQASADEIAASGNRIPVSAGAAGSDGGRRPLWLAVGAIAAVLVVAGLLVWAGLGRSGSNARPTAGSPTRPVATATSPTSAPSASLPPSPSPSPSASAPASSSAGASGATTTGPTLPLTGFEHPIRLMGAAAAAFVFTGAFLLYAGRRRDDESADA